MTLLIAAVEAGKIWMVGDTLVSGGVLGVREREYVTKIVPGEGSLVGYAGDIEIGLRVSRKAAAMASHEDALGLLVEASKQGGVDFALAFISEGTHLYKVSSGNAERRETLHLGSDAAFETFQRLRHQSEPSFAPLALKTFMVGAPQPVPAGLGPAIRALCELFSAHQERDVGGWAVPYFLNNNGAHVCDYAFGTSDPVLDDLKSGDVVPHGTAQGGGTQLSFCGLRAANGWVVYWLQLPGGMVYLQDENGQYVSHRFSGTPTQFLSKCLEVLGIRAELFVSDRPSGPIERLSISLDEKGVPVMVVAGHTGSSFSLATPNPGSPFVATPRIPGDSNANPLKERLTVEVEEGAASVIVALAEGQSIRLTTSELDSLIDTLGGVRSRLEPAVSLGFPDGEALRLNDDPAWRTYKRPHPQTPGTVLCLRSQYFGWQSFHLPPHEVANLGRYLVNAALER